MPYPGGLKQVTGPSEGSVFQFSKCKQNDYTLGSIGMLNEVIRMLEIFIENL